MRYSYAMTKDALFQFFGAGMHFYKSARFNQPELNLVCFSWRRVELPLDEPDYRGTSPGSQYYQIGKDGKEEVFNLPLRMKSLSLELPFDLRRFKKHYLNMFGEHLLAHEIEAAMDNYYGDKQLLEAVFDQDYIELAFLINESRSGKTDL